MDDGIAFLHLYLGLLFFKPISLKEMRDERNIILLCVSEWDAMKCTVIGRRSSEMMR